MELEEAEEAPEIILEPSRAVGTAAAVVHPEVAKICLAALDLEAGKPSLRILPCSTT